MVGIISQTGQRMITSLAGNEGKVAPTKPELVRESGESNGPDGQVVTIVLEIIFVDFRKNLASHSIWYIQSKRVSFLEASWDNSRRSISETKAKKAFASA